MGLFGRSKDELLEEIVELRLEKTKLSSENTALLARLQDRDNTIDNLNKQVTTLQDALVAKEAPEAYRDRKADEYRPTEEEIKDRKERQTKAKLLSEHLNNMEEPNYFKEPDDLMKYLNPVLMEGTEPQSLHGNNES